MSNEANQTRVDRFIRRVRNNRIFSVLIFTGIVIIALANFTDGIDKLRKFFYRTDTQKTDLENPSPGTTPSGGSDSCLSAKIVFPKGARTEQDAANYPIQSNVTVSWTPSTCVMVVEYHQEHGNPEKHPNKKSGDEIRIGYRSKGKTEIKIWREGSQKPSDSIWVWVE